MLAIGAIVLASSNSEMFQGRAGRDVGSRKAPSADTTTTATPAAAVTLKLDASANVLSGSHARLLALVSKGYKVTVIKDINAAPKPIIFECADLMVGVADAEQKYFECTSKNVDGKNYNLRYIDNKSDADFVSLKAMAVGETVASAVKFMDLNFSVDPTSLLATIKGSDGSLSSTSAIPMSIFDTSMLKLTSVISPSGQVESFYCDLDPFNDGENYSCKHSSFWLNGNNVNYITRAFEYINSIGAIHYKDTDSAGDITAKSEYDRIFYFSK